MATQAGNRIEKTKGKAPALACEKCRKKKTKCSGKPAPCLSCVQSKAECVFPTEVKPRKTPVRSARRIDGLEGRLSRIEGLLEGTTGSSRSDISSASSKASAGKWPDPLSEVMSRIEAWDVHKDQVTIAAGKSSDSPNTGPFESASNSRNEATSRQLYPIPPLDQTLESMSIFFNTMNRIMPLCDERTLFAEVEEKYSTLTSGDPSLFALVNVLLAFSYQIRSNESSYNIENTTMAQSFLRNAIAWVDKLLSQPPTMRSAQTLVAISRLLKRTSNTSRAHIASSYIALATRQIFQLGLHRKAQSEDVSNADLEWRRRLFWMTYSVDMDLSLRLDQPPSLRDDDIDVDLPDWNAQDGLGFIPQNGRVPINYFRLDIDLARLQSKIYARLYSLQSCRQLHTESDNANTACQLALQLLAWKNQIPGVDNFNPITLTQSYPQSSVIAMAMLYLHYFNSLTMVHRLAFFRVDHMDVYKSSFEDLATNPCPTQVLCVEAARVALHLFPILPHGNVPCMWMSVDYFISAAVILLAGIIYGAAFNLGSQDLRLVRPVLVHLQLLSQYGDAERLKHIWASCHDLETAAQNLVEEREAAQSSDVAQDEGGEVDYGEFEGMLEGSYQELEQIPNDLERGPINSVPE